MAVKDTFQESVKTQLAISHGTKWGAEESLNVILDLINEEVLGQPDLAQAGKQASSEEFMSAIKTVINPSQFAQALESQKMLTRSGKKERVKNSLLDFGAK